MNMKYVFMTTMFYLLCGCCAKHDTTNADRLNIYGCGLSNGGSVVLTEEDGKLRIFLFRPNKSVGFGVARLVDGNVVDFSSWGGLATRQALHNLMDALYHNRRTPGYTMTGGIERCLSDIEDSIFILDQ